MRKALYRKYRSRSLDEIVGQQHITDTLKQAIKKGVISHAYLFTGPRGTGKTSIARILAHEINELPYDEESTHLDIIEIDAASNRRIDEIRDLRDKVHIAPTSSKYKVYIIDEVHMLTREAFNALLKTLEEPPEHAVFILATTELHKVPETIVSRTQKYTFRLYDISEIVGHLRAISDAEKIPITDEALELLADHGRGSFRDSISMLDQIAGFDYDEISYDKVARLLGVPNDEQLSGLLDAVATHDTTKLFASTSALREQGVQTAKIAQSLIATLRSRLSSGDTEIPHGIAVDIMKAVLPLTASNNATSEALEIALLDCIPIDSMTNTKPESTHTDPKLAKSVAETIKEQSIAQPQPVQDTAKPTTTSTTQATETKIIDTPKVDEPKQSDPEPTKPSPKSAPNASKPVNSDTDAWSSVLSKVKADNGTLHGILRMADVIATDDSLTLTFQFVFHKNQLQKPANLQAFNTYVEEAYGGKRELIMDVRAADAMPKANTQTPSEPQPAKPATENNDLKNISNIFGKSELLD